MSAYYIEYLNMPPFTPYVVYGLAILSVVSLIYFPIGFYASLVALKYLSNIYLKRNHIDLFMNL